MRTRFCWLLLPGLLTLFCLGPARGDNDEPKHAADKDHVVITPDKLKWGPAPPAFPKGAQIATVTGDPTKEGLYVIRLKLPAGYKVPAHFHPQDENVTVLSGTFHIGMGDKFDKTATKAMPAGAYGHWAAGMTHFVWAKVETVLQFHGMGPWSIQYVNPDDDPRKKKE